MNPQTYIDDIAAHAARAEIAAERDRLRAFIKRWQSVIVGGDDPKNLEGWAQDFNNEAEAVLK